VHHNWCLHEIYWILHYADALTDLNPLQTIARQNRQQNIMDALEALHTRTSAPRLTDPPPDHKCLNNIVRAALRAADHALLRPSRFLLIRGTSLDKLGDLFVEAALVEDPELSEVRQDKLRRKPFRAPLILVGISSFKQHPKVPAIEQDFSTAAAFQNMLLAAHAQGIGAMWRTGSMAYNTTVMQGLGLAENEKIIGFLYLGKVKGATKKLSEPDVEEFFQEW